MASITSIKERILEMEPGEFQVLCDHFLAKKGLTPSACIGTKAGTHKTTPGTPDTYICTDNNYIFVEYTTTQQQLISKIREDLDKCFDVEKTGVPLDRIDKILYFHTSSRLDAKDDMALKDYCKTKGVELDLIGIDSLAEALAKYPSIIKEELHLDIGTEQIQSLDDFIKGYNAPRTAASLDTSFLFRTQEIDKLQSSLKDKDVVVITGDAGVGKTRLAIEFAQKHAANNNETLLCIHDRSLPIYDELITATEKPGQYFIIIDDANQISNLKLIIETLFQKSEDHSFKVIITVRKYAIDRVRKDINGFIDYDELDIKKLEDSEIKEIVSKNLGIINSLFLDRIAVIAKGNARLAILAGNIAIKENSLSSINDMTDLYDAYFGTVFKETEFDHNKETLIIAGIVAFLDRIHLDETDFIMFLLQNKGISHDTFFTLLHKLHDYEIIDIYHDKAVKFSDQCFANYILKYVFFDMKYIMLSEMILCCFASNRNQTVEAINTLAEVFKKKEIHDYIQQEVQLVWNQYESENSPLFHDFVTAFYPLNSTAALLLLQKKINHTDSVLFPVDHIDTDSGKNDMRINDDVISILHGFSLSDDVDIALDLFFTYYLKRPDLFMQFYHACTLSFGISVESFHSRYYPTIHFLNIINDFSNDWENDYIVLLFVEFAKELLRFEFNGAKSTRSAKTMITYRISLEPSDSVKQYREQVWSYLKIIAEKKKAIGSIRSILNDYGFGIDQDSTPIVIDDAPHMLQIIRTLLSADSINDCLLVKHVSEIFARCNIQIDELSPWLHNEQMNLYRLLSEASYDVDSNVQIRKQRQAEAIQGYLSSCSSKSDEFQKMLMIYQSLGDSCYQLREGLQIALQTLETDQTDYLHAVELILHSKTVYGIDTFHIIEKLFSFLSPAEIKGLLLESSVTNTDLWLYSFYYVMPQDHIHRDTVEELLSFLDHESDQSYGSFAYRNIMNLVEKYSKEDPHILAHAVSTIFDKRSHSPQLVRYYLEYLFYDVNAEELIEKMDGRIDLLSDVYLWLWDNNCNSDLYGHMLLHLLKSHPLFIDKLSSILIKKAESTYWNPREDHRFSIVYSSEDYINTIDQIIEKCLLFAKRPHFSIPTIMKLFLFHPANKPLPSEKQVRWLMHYIELYASDEQEMSYVFRSIDDLPLDLRGKCIRTFVEHNQSYEAFEKIPLTPTSFGACGSFVPVYSRWISFLSSILPDYNHISTLQHKKRIEDRIAALKEEIVQEEINNILHD